MLKKFENCDNYLYSKILIFFLFSPVGNYWESSFDTSDMCLAHKRLWNTAGRYHIWLLSVQGKMRRCADRGGSGIKPKETSANVYSGNFHLHAFDHVSLIPCLISDYNFQIFKGISFKNPTEARYWQQSIFFPGSLLFQSVWLTTELTMQPPH